MMNIYDIAKLAGVSIATVSRVLNDKPGVSETARQKVLSVIDETDFVPNQLAKSLANKKSYVIGLVMPGINDYYSNRVDAINKVCKEEGYGLMITANYKDSNNIEEDLDNFNLLIEKRVDGIIYFPTHVSYEHLELLHRIQNRIPMVITDSDIDGLEVSSVIQDSFTPTLELMTYLIKGGHKHIAYINGLSYDQVNNKRFEAFKVSMTKAGLSMPAEYMLLGDFSLQSGYDVTKSMLEEIELKGLSLPTALFASNDKMAMGAMKAVVETGLRVPDDISIIGYDGIDFGQYANPPLTTVKVDQYMLGKLAAETLIQTIENKGTKVKLLVMVNEIVFGASSRSLYKEMDNE